MPTVFLLWSCTWPESDDKGLISIFDFFQSGEELSEF